MDQILDTLDSLYQVNRNHTTSAQRREIKRFVQDPSVQQLIVTSDSSTPNGITAKAATSETINRTTPSIDSHSKLIFIKLYDVDSKKTNDLNGTSDRYSAERWLQRIDDLLDRSDDANSVLNVLSELRKLLLQHPQHLASSRGQRIKTASKLVEWIDNESLSDLDGQVESIKRIETLRASVNKLQAIGKAVDIVLADLGDSYSSLKRQLQQTESEAHDEAERAYREWCDHRQRSFDSKAFERSMQSSIITFTEPDHVPVVNFNQDAVKLINDLRVLRSLGYAVPTRLEQVEQTARRQLQHAQQLYEVVHFYCSVADQILPCQQPMLIEQAKRLTNALQSGQSASITWSSSTDDARLHQWTDQLKSLCNQFGRANRTLRRYHADVLRIVLQLFDRPQLQQWNNLLAEAFAIVTKVQQHFGHSQSWLKHWDYQLYKALDIQFARSLLTSHRWLTLNSTSTSFAPIQMIWRDEQLAYDPPIQRIQEQIFSQIRKFLLHPFMFRGFMYGNPIHNESEANGKSDNQPNGFVSQATKPKAVRPKSTSDNLLESDQVPFFAHVFYRNAPLLDILYERAFEIIDELNSHRQIVFGWTRFYAVLQAWRKELNEMQSAQTLSTSQPVDQLLPNETIDGNYYNNPEKSCLPTTLDEFRSSLQQVKQSAQHFNQKFVYNEVACRKSSLKINLLAIRVFVDWLHSELERILIDLLRNILSSDVQRLRDKQQRLLQMFTQPSRNVHELQAFEQLIEKQLHALLRQLAGRMAEVQAKHELLTSWSVSKANLTEVAELQRVHNELQIQSESATDQLITYQQYLADQVSRQQSELDQQMQQFETRWKQSTANERAQQLFLDEMKLKCTELQAQREQLSETIKYFQRKRDLNDERLRLKFSDRPLPSEQTLIEFREFEQGSQLRVEFDEQMLQYTQMEWLVARHRLKAIADDLSKWANEDQHGLLRQRLSEWHELLPLLNLCRGECFEQPHWQQMLTYVNIREDESGKTLDVANLKLSHMYSARRSLLNNKSQLQALVDCAVAERSARETLHELETFEREACIVTTDYRASENSRTVAVIQNWPSLLSQLADAQLTANSIKLDDRSGSQLRESVVQWTERLNALQRLLNGLHSLQKQWMYLEPIFGSNAAQMPNAAEFQRTSDAFMHFNRELQQENRQVMLMLRLPNAQARLDQLKQSLANCQKQLDRFIAEARDRFPKFYFLSDEDLLRVLAAKVDLSQSGLLRKLFNNTIESLKSNDRNEIVAVVSVEGEELRLNRPIARTRDSNNANAIEQWLRELSVEITHSLQQITLQHLQADVYQTSLFDSLPNQVLGLCRWIEFTKQAQQAIGSRTRLQSLQEQIRNRLDGCSARNSIDDKKNAVLAIKLRSAILDLVHFESVVDQLIVATNNSQQVDVNDWRWQQQLRFYHVVSSPQSPIQVCLGLAQMWYSFEYVGCQVRLVHTPLTHRCYLTCAHAIQLGMGAQLQGPAGTGKTESIKCLAQHLGRSVLVFNCDESLDLKSLMRILQGLLRCGYWGCFDEFNRLPVNVLSALSTVIASIQRASSAEINFKNQSSSIASKSVRFQVPGESIDRSVNIDWKCALFITLNPLGKRYQGRNQLPDSLQSLFLPISMQSADIQQIVNVTLLGEEFPLAVARSAAEKIKLAFELSATSLSAQTHYDWGLRSIKSCLLEAGQLLRTTSTFTSNLDQSKSTDWLQDVIVRAIRTQIHPKLVRDDRPLFDRLLGDVFGRDTIQRSQQMEQHLDSFVEYVQQAFNRLQLIENNEQIRQVIQLRMQMRSRLGVALVGPAGTGKSTVWKLLLEAEQLQQKALTADHTTKEKEDVAASWAIQVKMINAKSLDRRHLLGYQDSRTGDWVDGLLPQVLRQLTQSDTTDRPAQRSWLIWDGVIEPNWAEALNSVLDDNHVYTLPTGERIDLNPQQISVLFETDSLQYASPATISRLGILAFTKSCFDLMIQAWSTQASPDQQKQYAAVQQSIQNQSISYEMKINQTTAALISLHHELKIKSPGELESIELLLPKNHVVFESHCEILRLLRIYFRSNAHVLCWGQRSIGKKRLIEQTLSVDDQLIVVHCHGQLTAQSLCKQVMRACTKIEVGSDRCELRPRSGAKRLVLLIDRCELLPTDQWNYRQVLQMLSFWVTFGGWQDYASNAEWIQLPRFQLCCTSQSLENIDSKLLCRLAVLHVVAPSSDELDAMLTSIVQSSAFRSFDNQLKSRSTVRKVTDAYDRLWRECSNNLLHPKAQGYLGPARQILHRLSRHAVCTARSIGVELFFAFQGNHSDRAALWRQLKKIMPELQTPSNGPEMIECCDQFNHPIRSVPSDEFEQQVFRDLDQWQSDVEFNRWTLCVPFEWQRTYSFVQQFLSHPSGPICLHLLGQPATFRKLSVRIAAHQLQFDVLWNANRCSSAVQLHKQLIKLLDLESVDGSDAASAPHLTAQNEAESVEETKKVLVLLDQSSIRCVPSLEFGLYAFVREWEHRISSNRLHLRIVITCDSLHAQQAMTWSQVSLVYQVESLSKASVHQFTEQLIDQEVLDDLEMIGKESDDEANEPEVFRNQKSRAANSINHHDSNVMNQVVRWFVELREMPTNAYLKHNYRAFAHVLHSFGQVYTLQRADLRTRADRLQIGVMQLQQAQSQVEQLKAEAEVQQKQLAAKRAEASETLQLIADSMRNSEVQQTELRTVRSGTEDERTRLQQRKAEIDAKLSQIEPQLKEANRSVGGIRPEALNEIRSLRVAPEVVRDILEAVLRLLGNLDTSWNAMKAFLGRRGVREELIQFDCARVDQKRLLAVQQIVTNKPNSFVEASARRASTAAAPLASWVLAVLAYSSVLVQVAPLQAELQRLQSNLQSAETRVGLLNEQLLGVDDLLQQLQSKLTEATVAAAQVELQLNATLQTLQRSGQLVKELAGEYERWRTQLSETRTERLLLPAMCALVAYYVCVLCSISCHSTRKQHLQQAVQQLKLPFTVETVYDTVRRHLLDWFDCAQEEEIGLRLPDSLQTPLLIDPERKFVDRLLQQQVTDNKSGNSTGGSISARNPSAARRRRSSAALSRTVSATSVDSGATTISITGHSNSATFGSSTFTSVQLLDANTLDFGRKLELAVRFGGLVLIRPPYTSNQTTHEHIALNALLLQQVLAKQLFGSTGGRQWIEWNDRRIEISRQLRLCVLGDQSMTNASLSANESIVFGRCLFQLDLTPDDSNVATRFLGLIIELKQPQLERQRIDADRQRRECIGRVRTLEQQLLVTLNGSASESKSLLEDSELLQSLKQLKQSAQQASETLQQVNEMSAQLDRQRQAFASLADFGAELYFRLRSMQQLQAIYRLSLAEFEYVFVQAVQRFCAGPTSSAFSLTESLQHELIAHIFVMIGSMMFADDRSVMARFLESQYERLQLNSDEIPNVKHFLKSNLNVSSRFPLLLLTRPGCCPTAELDSAISELQVEGHERISLSNDSCDQLANRLKAFEQSTSTQLMCLMNLNLVPDWFGTLTSLLQQFVSLGSSSATDSTTKAKKWLVLIGETNEQLPVAVLELCRKFAYEIPETIRSQLKQLDLPAKADNQLNNLAYLHSVCCVRRSFVPIGWLKAYPFSFDSFQLAKRLLQIVATKSRSNQNVDFVQNLLTECVYGPLLDSEIDWRTLRSLVNRWFDRHRSPIDSSLPNQNEFELIALPVNIDRWKSEQRSFQTKQKLITLSAFIESRQPTKAIETNEHLETALKSKSNNKSLEMLQRAYSRLNLAKLADYKIYNTPKSDSSNLSDKFLDPLQYFNRSEQVNVQQLALCMRDHLKLVIASDASSFSSSSLSSSSSKMIMQQLMFNQTPDEWLQRFPFGSADDAQRFMQQFSEMAFKTIGRTELSLRDVVPLNAVSNPAALMTAIRQTAARSLNCEMSSLHCNCLWPTPSSSSLGLLDSKDSMYQVQITGLVLMGAEWDGSRLRHCTINSSFVSNIPNVKLCFTSQKLIESPDSVELPVFCNESREHLLIYLRVPCQAETIQNWIQNGVAFYINY